MNPVPGSVVELRNIVQVSAHVERDCDTGGTCEDAQERDCLGDDFFRDGCDREQANGESKYVSEARDQPDPV